MNTAAHAAQLGRPLGAVPGSVHSATSAGTHALLRDYAAVLVRDAADMAELARGADEPVVLDGLERLTAPEDPLEARVLDVLARRPRSALDLAARAGMSLADTTAALGMLSLTGAAKEGRGGWSRP